MLETHLNSPVARRRLRTGPAADHIDAFADWLHLHGYRPTSINNLLRSLAAWTDWMLAAGFTAQEFLVGFEACKLAVEQKQRVLYSRGPNHYSVTAASVFIRFLQHQGELPLPATPPSASDFGLCWESSVRGCANTVVLLIRHSMSMMGSLRDFLMLWAMTYATIPPRLCAPSSWIGHVLMGSIGPRALSSRFAPSSASSALLGDALRAWNTPSPVLPRGS